MKANGTHLTWLLFCSVLTSNLIKYSNAEQDDDGLEQTNVLLYIFFGLAMGILTMQFLSFFGEVIPYTVLVFLLGMLFSLAEGDNGNRSKLFMYCE